MVKNNERMMSLTHNSGRALEPERAPNTRGTGSGFICVYIYLYVCLWGDHFSEERVKF